MRILTLDLENPGESQGIEVPLRRLASSIIPLDAAYWHKLVELVEHLESSWPPTEVWGDIMLKELKLFRPQPVDLIREKEMKKFIEEWRALNPDLSTSGKQLHLEMRRRFPPRPNVSVSIRADWRAYGPICDGIPVMHYRLEVKHPGKTTRDDYRAKDTAEAERIVRDAFGW